MPWGVSVSTPFGPAVMVGFGPTPGWGIVLVVVGDGGRFCGFRSWWWWWFVRAWVMVVPRATAIWSQSRWSGSIWAMVVVISGGGGEVAHGQNVGQVGVLPVSVVGSCSEAVVTAVRAWSSVRGLGLMVVASWWRVVGRRRCRC